MPNHVFVVQTAEEVAEQLGKYFQRMLGGGATASDLMGIVLRTPGAFMATAGTRLGLLAEIHRLDPKVAAAVEADTTDRPGYVPVITMDQADSSHGIEWVGPFTNSPGGVA